MSEVIKKEASCGLVDVPGFRAAGVHCDIRGKSDNRLDLALVVSDAPCSIAGVFTRNRMAAAPVRLGREQLSTGSSCRGFIANSGNANACTGENGMKDAMEMRRLASVGIGCSPEDVYVCSTGRIGKRLPLELIKGGIDRAIEVLGSSPQSGFEAADAILTSDTRRKVCTCQIETEGSEAITVSGMAKGAGMIEPNMATMLAFIATDAKVKPIHLQELIKSAADVSFNVVTVDGDESTNDTLLFLANGKSGIELSPESLNWPEFREAVETVCLDLAKKIVGDGEKISKVVEVNITGAKSSEEANAAARAVANSLLVKSSWYGNDPNWGRVLDAVGYSGAEVSEETIQMWYRGSQDSGPVPVFSKGTIFSDLKADWVGIVSQPGFSIIVDLGSGQEQCRLWSTDLTEGYVNFNKSE